MRFLTTLVVFTGFLSAQVLTFHDPAGQHQYLKTKALFVQATASQPDVPKTLASSTLKGAKLTPYSRNGWFANAERNAALQSAGAVPVFLDLSELPNAARDNPATTAATAELFPDAVRLMTERLLVRARGQENWVRLTTSTSAIRHEASLLPGWDIVYFSDAWSALDAVQWMQSDGWEFSPLLARQQAARQSAPTFGSALKRTVTDTLYPNQWHFTQDRINLDVANAWDFVTGTNLNITVVDDGLDILTPDLADAAWPLSSNYHANFNGGPSNDPSPKNLKNHGTNSAGLAAARGFNTQGVVGVAPEARLMGIRLIDGAVGDDSEAAAFGWQPAGTQVAVSSNSWGPTDDGIAAGRIGPLALAAHAKAATQNRGGLGTVIVISAGNGRAVGDDASYDEYSSSKYAIAVGAVNRQGQQSSYSESGMNVAVSAFGGEFNPPDVLWTTNVAGAAANAALKTGFPTSQAPVDYSDAFNGTSAAAPQVSGAAALLLQRNPRLGYRDVKEILMRSARHDVLSGGDPFVDNKGGFMFSHSFGAGLLNIAGALNLADRWTNLGPLVDAQVAKPNLNLAIPDGSTAGATTTFDFTNQLAMRVESVEITVNVTHPLRGDVKFTLTGPTGMVSIAQARPPDTGSNFVNYTFTSVRHWGTSSQGIWTLKVEDTRANNITGILVSANLHIYGTSGTPPVSPPPTAPVVAAGGVIGALSFGGGTTIAPGSWIEIYGTNLSVTTRTWADPDFVNSKGPTVLDGVSVSIGGKAAFVGFISPGQVNVQVPDGVPPGPASLILSSAGLFSDPYTVTVVASKPAILAPSSFKVGGLQYIAALFPDNVTFVLPNGAIAGVAGRPAKPGETMILYALGLGAVTPPTPPGTIASGITNINAAVDVRISGTPATLGYDGLTPGLVGLYQLNIVVPNVPDSDAATFTVSVGGTAVPGTFYTAVHH